MYSQRIDWTTGKACICTLQKWKSSTIRIVGHVCLQEDDTYFNRARITSTLAYENTIWIGTGEGNLIIYEILECAQLMTPTELSPSVETTSSMSYILRPEKRRGMCYILLFCPRME